MSKKKTDLVAAADGSLVLETPDGRVRFTSELVQPDPQGFKGHVLYQPAGVYTAKLSAAFEAGYAVPPEQIHDDPIEQRIREYYRLWNVLSSPDLTTPRIDGRTHAQIRAAFESRQREDTAILLTPAQTAWARAEWSAQLRAKTQASKEKVRNEVMCQGNWPGADDVDE